MNACLVPPLHEKGLTVKADKCLFGQSSLWFYGYTLISNGLQADKKNPAKTTRLTVDASIYGLGAILSNIDQDVGAVRNVAYASRSLSPIEQKYSQTEREALQSLTSKRVRVTSNMF